jgi:putative spermidine/putrescine transport system permease protein
MLSQPSPSETLTPAASMASSLLLGRGWHLLRQPYVWLLAPVMLVLAVFFVLPLLTMIQYSVYTQVAGSTMTPDVTLDNFYKFFQHELYRRILVKTLSNALITTLLALLLGYPVAYAIARGQPLLSRLLLFAVISPLLVGIIIRTYGWTVLLGRHGLVNQTLQALGLISSPWRFLGTDTGVIITLLHVYYPFMVLPLVGVLQHIERPLEDAAMVLGANRLQVFWRIILPLSLPGVAAGSMMVFLLTAGAFVTPRLIGKNLTKWLLMLVEEQILTVFDWPFGAAMAVIFGDFYCRCAATRQCL